ncbi:hypothetical protein [Halovivax gelatinilyticus]|uniref:hypothetical protein n=1 Tax=Halovivax gelatinilyticus TaxID=2961597 RepID=UPI0020CA631C|nr:hypothetical protein [Halovivax gelatinilyticus]
MMREREQLDRLILLLTTLSFSSIAVGTLIAYQNPATNYEISIYQNTPTTYWISLVFALSTSVFILVATNPYRTMGILLGMISIISLLGLPLIRGYHQVGGTDAMTHLGATREILWTGELVSGIRYPMIHILGAELSLIFEQDANTVLYFVSTLFAITFSTFIFIFSRRLFSIGVGHIALLTSFMFLPINQISTSIEPHPTSQAILYLPVVLFGILLYYGVAKNRAILIIALLVVFYIHLHPQQAANLVLLLLTLSGLIFVLDKMSGDAGPETFVNRHLPSIITFSIFWIFMGEHDLLAGAVARESSRLLALTGRGIQTIEGRADSVETVGGSFEEIFIKIFLINFIFCTFFTYNLLKKCFAEWDVKQLRNDFEFLISIGTLSVVGFVVISLIGGTSDQFARHLGFVMVVVTIIGSVFIHRLYLVCLDGYNDQAVKSILAILLLVMLLFSAPVIFPSEYIYRGSGHVPETQMDGYETALNHYDGNSPILHTRTPAYRYADATNGPDSKIAQKLWNQYRSEVSLSPDHFANQSLHTDDQSFYISVLASDKTRDADMYRGFRFSFDDFDYLDRERGINKAFSNGQFELYKTGGVDSYE